MAFRVINETDIDTGKGVRFTAQTLDSGEQDQARLNIAAASVTQVNAKVSNTITNGVTDVAPAQDAVFDALAGKEPSIGAGLTTQVWRGDKSWIDMTALPINTATASALNNRVAVDQVQGFDITRQFQGRDNTDSAGRDDIASFNVLDVCPPSDRASVVSGAIALDTIWDAAFAAAVARGKSEIFIPEGNYSLSEDVIGLVLNSGANGIGVRGAGLKTKITKLGTGSIFYTRMVGPVMTGGRLDVSTVPGDLELSVETGQGVENFAAGDLLVLNDLGTLIIDTTRHGGEFVEVLSVDVGTRKVVPWHPIKYAHSAGTGAGQYARLTKPTMITGVYVKDMWLDGGNAIITQTDYVNTNDVSMVGLIPLKWCRGAEVSGLRITNFAQAAIRFIGCYNCRVSKIDAINGGSATTGTSDPTSSEGLGGFGYVVDEVAMNQGLQVSGVNAVKVRHLYTTNAAPLNDATLWNYGESYGTVVSDCNSWSAKNMAYDTHEVGKNIIFDNCWAFDCHYSGFQIRTRDTIIKNCGVINSIGPAVWNRGNQSGNAYASRTHIHNFTAKYTNQGVTFDSIDWKERGAIVDDAPNTRIDGLMTYKTGGPAIEFGSSFNPSNCQYQNLLIEDPCQLAATNTMAIKVRGAGTTGYGRIANARVFSSDAKVSDLVKVESAMGSGTLRMHDIFGVGQTGAVVNNASSGTASVGYNYDIYQRIAREGAAAQYFETNMNASNNAWRSRSDPTSAKPMVMDVSTNDANDAPSGGNLFYDIALLGTSRLRVGTDGTLTQSGAVRVTAAGALRLPSFTAAEIGNATNGVNTTQKNAGICIWDSTNTRPLFAKGAATTSPWGLADGTTAITPA